MRTKAAMKLREAADSLHDTARQIEEERQTDTEHRLMTIIGRIPAVFAGPRNDVSELRIYLDKRDEIRAVLRDLVMEYEE